MWFFIIVIFIFGIYIIQLYKIHKITVNKNGYIIYSLFSKQKEFKFDNIELIM